jgi:hypothetical protein
VYRRLSLRLLCLLLTLALPASAQFTRDNAANKKIDEAINEHYLATDFDKAEGVLTGTVTACGDKCSPGVLARAWMYVGIVRGSGKNGRQRGLPKSHRHRPAGEARHRARYSGYAKDVRRNGRRGRGSGDAGAGDRKASPRRRR